MSVMFEITHWNDLIFTFAYARIFFFECVKIVGMRWLYLTYFRRLRFVGYILGFSEFFFNELPQEVCKC